MSRLASAVVAVLCVSAAVVSAQAPNDRKDIETGRTTMAAAQQAK
jgi:hypothetical protein